ncbi:MAG: zinc metallopeptidase [Pirellulaceae bacterium]|nr:zinc metallopeptidase [Pirellulaceae bacterium]
MDFWETGEMRWKGRQQSENVEDVRGMRPGVKMAGGGGFAVLIIIILAMFFNFEPQPLLDAVEQAGANAPQAQASGVDDEYREFISVVLRDNEVVWEKLIKDQVRGGSAYRPPKLRIFSDQITTGCGRANAAMGPFYCPADQTVYIDPTFFRELKRRHRAPGDFAQAYVIAHEVAHHVQNSLGLMKPIEKVRRSGDKQAINQASVRLELQADYLAGVWAHHAQKEFQILEKGDIAEAMNAANQIGDDTLQRMSQGFVIPERFTHGTSKQRVFWFKEGLRTGDLGGCEQLFTLDYQDL